MKSFSEKVVVVTGAASGIGRSLAHLFASEGAKLVVADIEAEPLDRVAAELRVRNTDVFVKVVDVSLITSVNELAESVFERHGTAAVLCANAGVGAPGGPIWTSTSNDWSWMIGVNLMGVVHGVQAFLPAMLARAEEGHILITSSIAGLRGGPGGIYDITKHAVTRFGEVLWHDLQAIGARVGCTVLCPGRVATRINSSIRNRPQHLTDGETSEKVLQFIERREAEFLTEGVSPDEVAAVALDAIRSDRFYAITHDWGREAVEARLAAILDGRRPATSSVSR